MLYSTPAWVVNTIVPVVTAQVGWVTDDVVGVVGAVGTAFTDTLVTEETQVLSAVLLVLKACEPGVSPENVVDAW